MHPYDVTDVMAYESTQEQSLAVTSNGQPKISVSTEPLSSHSVVNTPFSARFFADRVANTLRMPPMPVTSADSPSPSCVVPPKIIFKGVCKLYHSLHASSMNALVKSVPKSNCVWSEKSGLAEYDGKNLVLFSTPGTLCIPCLKQSNGVKWKHGVSSAVSTTL